MPFNKLSQWLEEESYAGAPDPAQAVLATVTADATPHSRVIALREISPSGLIFFTQAGTRKVSELEHNPRVSLNFWLELKERQIIIEGVAEKLDQAENSDYWAAYPRIAQIRFTAYAPTSGQPIQSKQHLEEKKMAIEHEYQGKEIQVNSLYCGYRIKPIKFLFYAYRTDELSDVTEYTKQDDNHWRQRIISP